LHHALFNCAEERMTVCSEDFQAHHIAKAHKTGFAGVFVQHFNHAEFADARFFVIPLRRPPDIANTKTARAKF
jgi:hypothetical protein